MANACEFSAARDLQDLRKWRSILTEIGPKFGYYWEPIKTWLVVKSYALQKVESAFFRTNVKITTEDRRYQFLMDMYPVTWKGNCYRYL